jgi:uncharacterized membrane protein
MGVVWTIVGAVAGLLLGAMFEYESAYALGFVGGGAIGFLLSRVIALNARIRGIEEDLVVMQQTIAQAGAQATATAPRAAPAPVIDLRGVGEARPAVPNAPAEPFDLGDVATAPPPPPRPPASAPAHAWAAAPSTPSVRSAEPSGSDLGERAAGWIKAWFTEGNVPVKVGMLVLFAGVAALLKYAADEGWFTFPVEFRLVGVAAAAIAALVFAWRQRDTRRAFSLSLQGGAIGILLLTVFAAFRLYHLLPAPAAFALMIILVAGVCLLAVLQDALALAVLGILAGFAAPILISTGSGNHVALFSYYAVLNVAVFAIAWMRAWRVLNLIGFFFTYAIGTLWGVLRYNPALYNSTEPFLLLFFALYLAIPVLYALKLERERPDAVDGTLVFGNPLVAFALQAALLEGERMPMAMSALALGVIYMVLAAILIRRLRTLGESFAVLALGFSTLAVPLALSARTTGCIFALEGAALVWLGLRQQRRLPRWIGLFLQLLAAGAYVIAIGAREADALPLANGPFAGAMLIALAAWVSAWLYQRAAKSGALSLLLYLWGLAWWFGAWLVEIDRFVAADIRLPAVLGLVAISAWLAAESTRIWQRPALAFTVGVLLWLALPLSAVIAEDGQVFADWSLLAHLALAVFGLRSLACLRQSANAAQTTAHLGWLWTWTVAIALSLRELGLRADLGDGWVLAMIGLPLLLMHALALRKPGWLSPPLSAEFPRYRPALLGSQALVLGFILLASLLQAGASTPLAFVPVLNPLELFQIAMLAALASWLRDADAPENLRGHRAAWIAVSGFMLITAATLRAVHHLGDIAWNERLLSASLSQTSLAVVWSILGVAGWVIGSRRSNRPLWLASAVLMAVVLGKLLLIDRQHLGNLFGIASFIAYGLLCTLVGYLAPAPPRSTPAGETA